jgi:hypothetical protein
MWFFDFWRIMVLWFPTAAPIIVRVCSMVRITSPTYMHPSFILFERVAGKLQGGVLRNQLSFKGFSLWHMLSQDYVHDFTSLLGLSLGWKWWGIGTQIPCSQMRWAKCPNSFAAHGEKELLNFLLICMFPMCSTTNKFSICSHQIPNMFTMLFTSPHVFRKMFHIAWQFIPCPLPKVEAYSRTP